MATRQNPMVQLNIRIPRDVRDWLDNHMSELLDPGTNSYRGHRSVGVEYLIRQEQARRQALKADQAGDGPG
jgi:hypothetical protein